MLYFNLYIKFISLSLSVAD